MANLTEIHASLREIQSEGNDKVALLHCMSKYPTSLDECSLEFIDILKNTFTLPIGYSDHCIGTAAAIAAGSLGISILEKHFTIDKTLDGPDHCHSADPIDLQNIMRILRLLHTTASRHSVSLDNRVDKAFIAEYRRGLYAKSDIAPDSIIGDEMIKSVRPQHGALSTNNYSQIVGKKSRKQISINHALTWEDVY